MAIKKSDLYSSLWASCDEVATLAMRVEEHLKRMGATWN